MTVYGHDPDRDDLYATWPAGIGHCTTLIAELDAADPDVVTELVQALSDLSEAMWDVYTDTPQLAELDEERQLRREQAHTALQEAADVVRRPNLPNASGQLVVSYNPVEEGAHQVGRALHRLGQPEATEAVAAEVAVESDAVRRALLGDLTGRARQAVSLDRPEASPAQVGFADQLLADDPFGVPSLATEIEPAAACVAAAHWLAAAATAAGAFTGNEPTRVVAEADKIEPVSVAVPKLVIEQICDQGRSPRDVVMELLGEALQVRQGRLPDLDQILQEIATAHAEAERYRESAREHILQALLPTRLTLLDPTRPTRELLEHLLDGIRSCLLVFTDQLHFDAGRRPVADRQPLEHPEGADWASVTDEDAYARALQQAVRREFTARVREQAEADRDRLL